MRRYAALAAALALVGCHKKTATPPPVDAGPPPTNRCDIDLTAWLQATGSGASAHVITDASDLFAGEAAAGQLGDVLMANDKIKVIVQQPGRNVGPDPYGGAIIDADVIHTGPGNDKFGKIAPFFNFGRTVDVDTLEILAPGGQGGPAIVAATGADTVNDYINVNNQLEVQIGAGEKLALNPDNAVNLRITTYYALKPGDSHVQMVTAFCNDSDSAQLLTAGDLIDPGGDVALLVPQSTQRGMGYGSYPDATTFLTWEATDNSIAYGVAPYKLNDMTTPETHSNSLTVVGVTGYIVGNKGGVGGLLEWVDASARNRSGSLVVPAKDSSGKAGSALIARDFVVGRDIGAVVQEIETTRAAKTGATLATYGGTVSAGGVAVANARVAAERPDPDNVNPTMIEAILVTDSNGHFEAKLPADDYTFTAWEPGHGVSQPVEIASGADGSNVPLTLPAGHTLTVTAADSSGNPIPAKVTVLCNGSCPNPPQSLEKFTDATRDPMPDDMRRTAFIPPSGTLSLTLPAGAYQVIVSHGPEDSIWPLTAPATPASADLTSGDQTLHAVLAKVVDTSGWLSADFHVHSVNSPDSVVPLIDRVQTFLAEDVNVLLATDHDFITDYAPTNQALGGTPFMATMVGEEITTFDYGHYNPWPLKQDLSNNVTRGALDWGNGTKDSLLIDDIIDGARAMGATTFQINHPNGNVSTFGGLELDADTLATHADPAAHRLPPSPNATANDTGLFPRHKWDAMEVMNGFTRSSFDGLLNNWMTFNANGLVVTATAVSDTHSRWSSAGGYPRSYVYMGSGHDSVATFDQATMSTQVNAHHVVGSLGLFVKAYAFTTGTNYSLTSLEADCTAAGAACARVGDTLTVGATGLDVVVDVQSPEWIPFDEIDLFDHRAARWMLNGVPDSDFAPEKVPPAGWQHQNVTLDATNKEAVFTGDSSLGCGQATCVASRYHAQAVFHIDQASGQIPASDDFFFVVVRDSNQSRDLMPLVWDATEVNGTVNAEKPAHAFAYTNAIYVDRDGDGKYDNFPHVSGTPPAKPHRALITGKTREERIRKMLQTMADEH